MFRVRHNFTEVKCRNKARFRHSFTFTFRNTGWRPFLGSRFRHGATVFWGERFGIRYSGLADKAKC